MTSPRQARGDIFLCPFAASPMSRSLSDLKGNRLQIRLDGSIFRRFLGQ
jgi:hypothetical protein